MAGYECWLCHEVMVKDEAMHAEDRPYIGQDWHLNCQCICIACIICDGHILQCIYVLQGMRGQVAF